MAVATEGHPGTLLRLAPSLIGGKFYRSQTTLLRDNDEVARNPEARRLLARSAIWTAEYVLSRGRRAPVGWPADEAWLRSIADSGNDPDDGSAGVREPRRPMSPAPSSQKRADD